MAIKKIQLTLTDEMQEKIEKLRKELALPTTSMVWYMAVTQFYKSNFPAYARAEIRTPEDKAMEKIREKEARNEIMLAKKRAIVKAMGGSVVTNKNGEVAIYYTYAGRKRYEQQVPLEFITDEIARAQYSPDKETIENLQKNKKVDY